MSNIFLSIITINFNNAEGLLKTINSVKSQTFTNYEHIIIDGNSSDDSITILKDALSDTSYAKQVSFWCSEKDNGIYDAMNKGIQHANGKFCLFLNSGDYLADNNVILRLNSYNLGMNIYYTNVITYTSTKERILKEPQKITAKIFAYNYHLNHQNMLIPTQYQKENLYSLQYKICSDFDFCVKAYIKDSMPFLFLNDYISKYEYESGISTNIKQRAIIEEECNKIINTYIPNQFIEDFMELHSYEYDWHGILKRIKILLKKYSEIKKRLFKRINI